MKNIVISLAVIVTLTGCASQPQMTGRDYCVYNGFKPGTKNYLACLREYNHALQQQHAQQQYYQSRPSPIQESTNRMMQIMNSQQPTSTCVTREEFGRLVTECR